MFLDPVTVTVDSEATSLPRISVGDMSARYRSSEGNLELNISHSANKRERSVVRLTTNKVGEDPFNSERSRAYTAQAYLVIDTPLNGVGFTDAELADVIGGLIGFLQQSDTIEKILGKES